MIPSFFWKVRRVTRRLWVRACLISAVAIAAAALAPLSALLPLGLQVSVEEQDLRDLLDIITNSMLAVTTFSLSIMVTAHLSADKGVTPRAHRLLQQDGRTQTVLATFVGTFLFGLTLTVIINAGLVEEEDLALTYLVTIAVIIFVVVAILRWIAHLDGLGSVELTARRVEEQARASIEAMNAAPFLGATALRDPARQIPAGASAIRAAAFGFVQNVDVAQLSRRLKEWDGQLYLAVAPGDWVDAGAPIAHVVMDDLDQERTTALTEAIGIGDVRVWEQDTAYGIIVLTEIAERALSPGINDPRTALDIVSRLTRLLSLIEPQREMEAPRAPRIHAPPFDLERTLLATLDPIARDGRNFVEVQVACQRCLTTLARHRDPAMREAACLVSRRALAHAEDGLTIEADLRRVHETAPSGRPAAIADGAGES